MRGFALINSIGETYELNDVRNFFHDPNGLGFLRNSEYIKLGDRYEITKDSFEQATPTGLICFKDEKISPAYDKYAKFVRFLQHIPLTLLYKSDSNHYIDVIPESLGKTEITKPLGLDVSIGFRALSLWYDKTEKEGTTSVQILSDSMQESPCDIAITGPVTNPIWTQSLDGVQISSGKVTATIGSGEVLHIRTDTNPYQIYKVNSLGNVTDLYANSDFTTKRFMYLRNGENIIACSGASGLKISGRIQYETV